MDKTTRETLQKQLQLLSERSKEPDSDISAITNSMVSLVSCLNSFPPSR